MCMGSECLLKSQKLESESVNVFTFLSHVLAPCIFIKAKMAKYSTTQNKIKYLECILFA